MQKHIYIIVFVPLINLKGKNLKVREQLGILYKKFLNTFILIKI